MATPPARKFVIDDETETFVRDQLNANPDRAPLSPPHKSVYASDATAAAAVPVVPPAPAAAAAATTSPLSTIVIEPVTATASASSSAAASQPAAAAAAPAAVIAPATTLLRSNVETHKRRRACVPFVSLIVTLMVVSFASLTKDMIISKTDPYFEDSDLSGMNDPLPVAQDFGTARLSANRVLWIVCDGLRYRATTENADLHRLLTSDTFAHDSKQFAIRAQLPSISQPNYLALLSGARPELHGQLANDDYDGPTPFDTVFRQAKIYDITHRSTNDGTSFTDILSDQLALPLPLDADIPELPGENTVRHDAMNEKDEWWANRIVDAYTNVPPRDTPELYLAYFADVDARGHQHGATSERYQSAVSNKTRIIERLLNAIPSDTIVVLTADHGHVDVGGHGGTAESIMNIPLVIYRRNSGFGDATFDADFPLLTPPNRAWTNLDVSATISGLLGIPVPRQSEGVFIDQTLLLVNRSSIELQYRDLWRQKQSLVRTFYDVSGLTIDDSYFDVTPPAIAPGDDTVRLAWYRDRILALVDAYERGRTDALYANVARNVAFSFAMGVLTWGWACASFQAASLIDLRALFCGCTRCCPAGCGCTYSPRATKQNWIALAIGALLFGLYTLIVVPSFFITYTWYRVDPEWRWDFTLFNSNYDAVRYLGATVLAPSISVVWLSTFWMIGIIRRRSRLAPSEYGRWLAQFYLNYSYSLLVAIVFGILFLVSQAGVCVFFPTVLNVQIITAENWTGRFQSLGLAAMYLALMFQFVITYSIFTFWLFDAAAPTGDAATASAASTATAPAAAPLSGRILAIDYLAKLKLGLISDDASGDNGTDSLLGGSSSDSAAGDVALRPMKSEAKVDTAPASP